MERQEDLEIEQLLGEIPRATSAAPVDNNNNNTNNNNSQELGLLYAQGFVPHTASSAPPPGAVFDAFGFGLGTNGTKAGLVDGFSELSLDRGTSGIETELLNGLNGKLPTAFSKSGGGGDGGGNNGGYYGSGGVGTATIGPLEAGHYLAALQQEKMVSALQAQKQQVLLLQMQLEEERRRRQRVMQQQYLLHQLQERGGELYGFQNQACLAPYWTNRQLAFPNSLTLNRSTAGRAGWGETNTAQHAATQPLSFCRFYAQGYCSRGDLCPFLHVPFPVPVKPSSADVRSVMTNTVVDKLSDKTLRKGRQAGSSPVVKRKPTNGQVYGIGYPVTDEGGEAFYQTEQGTKFTSLDEVEGRIYLIAKDQHGCRFLQRKFDEGGPEEFQKIFMEIIDHIVDLMTDPFGNYLVQKLLDVCSEEQRLEVLRVICAGDQLVTISLNMHGTRAVQKLIETLDSPGQISMIISSLKQGVVKLIKDLNGNHVVQRCLQLLSGEHSQFIFDAAAQHCVDIATHRHGCCVLQRCVDFSKGSQKERLVSEIAANALVLSQDQYGNYVVQYILANQAWISSEVIERLEGNFAHLSMQKFSSNVVEKCLEQASEAERRVMIEELVTTSFFGHLLQDPFANYVVQCALTVTKGHLYTSLVEAIRPHAQALRSSPYGKRILSRINLKKA